MSEYSSFLIGDRRIGKSFPCFVIAEIGVNHNGDRSIACALIDVAVAVGADAVKFQTFSASALVSIHAPKAAYQKNDADPHESQYEMLQKLELSLEDHLYLFEYCRERHIIFLSTPFDEASVDLLVRVGVQAIKTPSGELTNLPYLAHIQQTELPVILSTGMATLSEVESAVNRLERNRLAILHCVSNYPAAPRDINLRAMETLHSAFAVPIGYSDHTEGLHIALAAVALGACIIEKHITLSRSMLGPDHRASIEPTELQQLVSGIRAIESALGDGRKNPATSEASTAAIARKSLFAVVDINAGEMITQSALKALRPGDGLLPNMLSIVCGRRAKHAIAAGTQLTWEMFI